jgi:hypothetical protein
MALERLADSHVTIFSIRINLTADCLTALAKVKQSVASVPAAYQEHILIL